EDRRPPEGVTPSSSGVSRSKAIFYGVSAALLVAIIATFRAVLVPFLLALVLAYVLAPLIDRLERVKLGKRTVPRAAAIVFVYLVLLAVLAGAIAWGAPRLVAEAQRLAHALPAMVTQIEVQWGPRLAELVRSTGLGGSSSG